jgi:hypothetical protein
MTQTTTHADTDAPAKVKYVRRLTIEDPDPFTDDSASVHLAARVLFDGEHIPGLVNLKLGYSVAAEGRGPTLVRLFVDADMVELPDDLEIDESGEYAKPARDLPRLAGRPVLTPPPHNLVTALRADNGEPAEIYEPNTDHTWRVHHFPYSVSASSGCAERGKGHRWIEAVFYVGEVLIVGKQTGDCVNQAGDERASGRSSGYMEP